MKLNTILKIAYKSCIILLIALTIGLDLGKYVVSVQDQQWIIDWNGTVSIYGNHIGLLISNYKYSVTIDNHFQSISPNFGLYLCYDFDGK
jgi:hypothetical protein